jgi:hypothetical protein
LSFVLGKGLALLPAAARGKLFYSFSSLCHLMARISLARDLACIFKRAIIVNQFRAGNFDVAPQGFLLLMAFHHKL